MEDEGDDDLGGFNAAMRASRPREKGQRAAEVIPLRGGRPPKDEAESGECPVVFLGQHRSDFWFFDHHGQVIRLTARQISQGAEINALFGPDGIAWLAGQFPARNKEDEIIVGKFAAGAVSMWILSETQRVGLFDPAMPMRGIGVWRCGMVPVLHLGHRLLWGGEWRRPGFKEGGALWPAYHAASSMAKPATAEQMDRLQHLMRRWSWRDPWGAEMAFGLWAAGIFGAAIPWRPHGFFLAEAGAGKSTLFKLLALANPLAKLVDDYTEAGLRQVLSTHASAILLDEADPDDQLAVEKLQRCIGLLRRASSGAGAVVLRGGAGGQSQSFTVVGSAIMGGTLPPTLNEADASRILLLGLTKLSTDAVEPSEAELAEVERLAPAFLARAIAVLPRYAEAFAEARAQILRLDGGSHRVADQIGSILAARHVLLKDGPFPEMGHELAEIGWAIPKSEERAFDAAPMQCWNHLLDSALESYRSGERPTFRRIIADALGPPMTQPESARSILYEHGMRVGPYPLERRDGPLCLYVRNSHPRLNAVFAGTRWAGGKWGEELSRLPDAQRPPNPVSLRKGEKHRCVVIPTALMPERWDTSWDTS